MDVAEAVFDDGREVVDAGAGEIADAGFHMGPDAFGGVEVGRVAGLGEAFTFAFATAVDLHPVDQSGARVVLVADDYSAGIFSELLGGHRNPMPAE